MTSVNVESDDSNGCPNCSRQLLTSSRMQKGVASIHPSRDGQTKVACGHSTVFHWQKGSDGGREKHPVRRSKKIPLSSPSPSGCRQPLYKPIPALLCFYLGFSERGSPPQLVVQQCALPDCLGGRERGELQNRIDVFAAPWCEIWLGAPLAPMQHVCRAGVVRHDAGTLLRRPSATPSPPADRHPRQ
jgi:hypothetical protein